MSSTRGCSSDLAASQRSMEFNLGWVADPIYFGDYPASMRQRVGTQRSCTSSANSPTSMPPEPSTSYLQAGGRQDERRERSRGRSWTLVGLCDCVVCHFVSF